MQKILCGRLLAVGSLLYGVGTTVNAQDATIAAANADSANGLITEVVVTGSNVRGAELDSIVNVQVLDRTEIDQTGGMQVSDMIAEIPANTGSQLYNESGQLSGTAQFVLRGLGFSSTLTLLNGRRAGVSPLSDKSGADFVDINQFPLLMVERIELLKDGSSAIYGSEAVAGVVNIITRRAFDGFEMSADYATSTNDAYSLNAATGHVFERGAVSLFATYYEQTGNVRTDFDWIGRRIGGNGVAGRSQLITTNGYPGTYALATTNASGQPIIASGALRSPDPNCEVAGGVFRINDDGTTNTTTCNFNFMNQIGVIPAERRYQIFGQAGFDLSDKVHYFNETSGSRNVNLVFKQPGGFSNGEVVGNAAGNIYVPADAPFNFFVADPANPNGIVYIDPSQWDPSVHQAVPLVGNFRPQGIHFSRDKKQTNTYFRMVNGFDVALTPKWNLTASHSYANAEFVEKDPVRINATALNSLIESGQYNPFATSILDPTLVSPKDGVSVAGNPDSVLDKVFYTANLERSTNQRVIDAYVSGPLLELPTGPVELALGGQHRQQTLKYRPDSLAAQGLADSSATDSPFSGSQSVTAAYAEALIGIGDNAELQAAVRHEDYGGAIGSSTDPKLAARVSFLSGMLSLRGSWGTSFQAPTLTQGATSQAFVVINDPVSLVNGQPTCSGTSAGNNVNVVTSGGGLKPQNSTNYNLGIDVRPIDALRLDASYWHYDYSDLIAAGQNGQSIVNSECSSGTFVEDPRAVRGAGGQLFQINTAYVNVGKVVTDGVDLSATWTAPAGALGDFQLRGDATHVNSFDVYAADGTVKHNAGSRNFTNNFAPIPRWRAAARGAWSKDIHEISVALRYTAGYRNDQSNNAPISSFTTTDLQYALQLNGLLGGRSSEIRVGANNVFDKDPPSLIRYNAAGQLISGTISDVDRPGYDPLSGVAIQGRTFYMNFSQKF